CARLDLRGPHERDQAQVSKPSFLYRLSVHVATRAAPLVARFDKKVARGLDGRRGLAARLAGWGGTQRDTKRPLIWMHAPSVGEGLQAKPVLETLRTEHPDWQLPFTFFSPSAEGLAKNPPVPRPSPSPAIRGTTASPSAPRAWTRRVSRSRGSPRRPPTRSRSSRARLGRRMKRCSCRRSRICCTSFRPPAYCWRRTNPIPTTWPESPSA